MNQCSRDCCKGKKLSLHTVRSVLELNCAFLDQARVVLEQQQADSALEPSVGLGPRGWVNQNQGLWAVLDSTEPLAGLGCCALELSEPSLAPLRGVWLLTGQG